MGWRDNLGLLIFYLIAGINNMANITQKELNNLYIKADAQGIPRQDVLSGLEQRGHIIEGYTKPRRQIQGTVDSALNFLRKKHNVKNLTPASQEPQSNVFEQAVSSVGDIAGGLAGAVGSIGQSAVSSVAGAVGHGLGNILGSIGEDRKSGV